MGTYNYNFFQIPASGPVGDGALGNQQSRDVDAKISTFGALDFGVRDSNDTTRLTKGFKSKDELQNPAVEEQRPSGNGEWYGAENNPFEEGSTVKHIRDDQAFKMTIAGVAPPMFDVMDINVALDTTLSGMNTTISGTTPSGIPLYYPNEGYSSFGGRTGGPAGYMS